MKGKKKITQYYFNFNSFFHKNEFNLTKIQK
jgi:hypothetical protein